MTTITEALRAARACIQQDRTSLADTGMPPDNTIEPDAAAGVAEYDAVLQQIDAALAGEQPASPDLSRWCVYLAGMISGWLEMARPQIMSMGDEARTKAIAGFIERRLWAMPKDTAPAPAVPSVDAAVQFILDKAAAYAAEFGHDDDDTLSFGHGPSAQVRFDHYNGLLELADELRAALTAAPTPPAQSGSSACMPEGLRYKMPPLVLNGNQLLAALDFIAPDRTEEQMEQQVCLALRDQVRDEEGGTVPAGLFVWYEEYPEEGALPLDDTPFVPPKQPAVPEDVARISAIVAESNGVQEALCHYVNDESDTLTVAWLVEEILKSADTARAAEKGGA